MIVLQGYLLDRRSLGLRIKKIEQRFLMAIESILGSKIGMSQIFNENGVMTPVTAVQAGPCTVTQIRTPAKDGYSAVQLGFGEPRNLNQPEKGHLKRAGKLFRFLREIRTKELGDVQVGQHVDVSVFIPGDKVNVVGKSKGRGFTGVVKRHGFAGGPKTHGQSDRQRAPGSIGSTTYPGRVLKGTKMAGHWGNERVSVMNLEIMEIDQERNLLLIKGAIPGAAKGLLIISKTKAT